MVIKNKKNYVILILFIIIVLNMPIIMDLINFDNEKFMIISTLGENKKMDDYYNNDDDGFNISINETISWNIYLENQMGELKYVLLRVKLLGNEGVDITLDSSNEIYGSILYENKSLIKNDNFWIIPFKWSIINMTNINNVTTIKTMNINNQKVNIDLINAINNRYIIKSEVWLYDRSTKNFHYKILDENIYKYYFNQMIFEVN